MYDRPAVVALREHLAAAVAAYPALTDEAHMKAFQERVCAVVDELKGAGWPPERVIVAVKQVANDAGLHSSRSVLSASAPLTERDVALVHMVRWCIERYYGVDGPAV